MPLFKAKILLVEDSPSDAGLAMRCLVKGGHYQPVHVETLDAAKQKLSECDLALLDLSLPDSDGLTTFLELYEVDHSVPIVVLTGLDDEDMAIQAIKLGAQDYLCKDAMSDNSLRRCITFALQRKEAEKERAELLTTVASHEDRLHVLMQALEATSVSMVLTEPHGDNLITHVNRPFEMLTGYAAHEVLGRNCRFLQGADRDQAEVHILNAAIAERAACHVVMRNYKKDGTMFWNDITVSPVFCKEGRLLNMVGIMTDATMRKNDEETTRRLMVMEKNEEFIATLTHDLKNPLIGTNRVLSHIVKDEKMSRAQINAIIEQIVDSNNDLLTLIGSMLEVYRNDRQPHQYMLDYVNLQDVVVSSVKRMEPLAASQNIELITEIDQNVPEILGNELALSRVLQNLLDNSLKFTEPGGNISVSIRSAEVGVKMQIIDSGMGIDAAEQDLIFERFGQAHSGRKNSSGSGLGLYLSKQIVEGHRGSIVCKSEPGKGTIFTLIFPQADSNLQLSATG